MSPGNLASLSVVTRTSRKWFERSAMDSSKSNVPSSRKATCVATPSISLSSWDEINTVISPVLVEQLLHKLVTHQRVQAAERLVQDEQLRTKGKRASQCHLHPHAM